MNASDPLFLVVVEDLPAQTSAVLVRSHGDAVLMLDRHAWPLLTVDEQADLLEHLLRVDPPNPGKRRPLQVAA